MMKKIYQNDFFKNKFNGQALKESDGPQKQTVLSKKINQNNNKFQNKNLQQHNNIVEVKKQPFTHSDEYMSQSEQPETEIDRQPTEEELCGCVLFIKKMMPKCKIRRIIELLHQNLGQDDYNDESKYRQVEVEQTGQINQLERKRMQEQFAKKMENSEGQPRFYEEREIAKLFCSVGYGYPTARQFLGENITPNRYNNVITTIVRLSYRKLQNFVIRYCDPKISMISREQLKIIKTPLVNCRSWLEKEEYQTFHAFVKLTYKLVHFEPDRQMTWRLHSSIMKQLHKRNRSLKGAKKDGQWTQQMQYQMVVIYLRVKNLVDVQKQMISQYAPAGYRNYFELSKVKNKFQQFLRLAIKKLYSQKQKYGILDINEGTQIPKLTEYQINKILKIPEALDVRLMILSFNIDKDGNARKLKWVFQIIAEFLVKTKNLIEDVDQQDDDGPKMQPKREVRVEHCSEIKLNTQNQLLKREGVVCVDDLLSSDLHDNKKEEE